MAQNFFLILRHTTTKFVSLLNNLSLDTDETIEKTSIDSLKH